MLGYTTRPHHYLLPYKWKSGEQLKPLFLLKSHHKYIIVATLTQSYSGNFSWHFLDMWRQEGGTTGQMGQSNKKSTAELLRAASNTFIRLCDAAGRTDPAWQQREAQPRRKEATRGYVAKTKTSSQRHICVTFCQDSREEDHRRHPQPTGPLSTQQHGHNAEFWLKLLPPCFCLTRLEKAWGSWRLTEAPSLIRIRWEKHVWRHRFGNQRLCS